METRITQQAGDWLNSQLSDMKRDLIALCELNSGSHNLRGLLQVEDYLTDYFAPLGLPPERLPLPVFAVHDDFGNAAMQSTTKALRWDWKGANATSPKLLLTIHYDTVYGVDDPFQKCESMIVDGEERVRGPGVIDAKGGIIVIRWAMLAAMRFLDTSKLHFSIILTPDEEIGSPATTELWKSIAHEYRFAMLYEPTLPDGSFVHQRKGTGTYTFVIRGRSAHSGRNFQYGKNALIHAARVALQIDALNYLRPGVTFNVGRVRGGDAVNVVPDLCVLRVNVRVNDDNDLHWAEEKIKQVIALFHQPEVEHRIELHGGIHSAPKVIDHETQRWMNQLEEVGARLNQPVQWKASGGASDGNKLAGLGLPNLDTFGPEGDALHSDQEWIRVESLARKSLLSFAMVAEFMNGEKG